MQEKIKDDTIYRQAAIDAVSKGCQEWRGIFGRCEENILALPAAQPERANGKWINDGDPATWVCSNCGYRVMGYNNTKFCPNCGSDNRGDQQS